MVAMEGVLSDSLTVNMRLHMSFFALPMAEDHGPFEKMIGNSAMATAGSTPTSNTMKMDFVSEMTIRLRIPAGVHLFNLKDDIGETTSLTDTHPEVVAELTKLYQDWRSQMAYTKKEGGIKKAPLGSKNQP